MSHHPLQSVPRAPHTCIWEITRRCNLRCIHCENQCGEVSPRELDRDRMRVVASDLVRLGCKQVHVTGGEPLLHPQWDLICRDFAGLGLRVSLITNGTLLGDAALDRAQAAGVHAVGISLDGLQATHDRIRPRKSSGNSPWREAVSAIERAVQRMETVVITAVNTYNLKEMPGLRDHLAALGVRRWQVQLVIPVGRALEVEGSFVLSPADLPGLAQFLGDARADGRPPAIDVSDTIGYYTEHELKLRGTPAAPAIWTGCQAGIRSVAITYDGRVRGCSGMPAEFDAGDLHDESIDAIWNDAERFAYSTQFDAANLAGPCRRCSVGSLCRAGCTTMAYWTCGSIYSNPYCLRRAQGDCA